MMVRKRVKNKASRLLDKLFDLRQHFWKDDFEIDLDILINHTGLIVSIVDFEVAKEGLLYVIPLTDWEGVGGLIHKHDGLIYLNIDENLTLEERRYIVAKGIAYQQLGMRNNEAWGIKLTSDLDTVREKDLVTFALELLMPSKLFQYSYECTPEKAAEMFTVCPAHIQLKLKLEGIK